MLIAVYSVLTATTAFAAETTTVARYDLDRGALLSSSLELPKNPLTAEGIHAAFEYAAANRLTELSIPCSVELTEQVKKDLSILVYNEVNKGTYKEPEYFNYLRKVSYSTQKTDNGFTLTIKWSSPDYTNEQGFAYQDAAFAAAVKVYNDLYANGSVSKDMTEAERAKVFAAWVCEHCEYKNDETRLCHTAYGVFVKGYAVCDGYTSALNTLLKLDGISCYGRKGTIKQNGELHLWTVAVLDGNAVNIDCTAIDSSKGADSYRYQFFAVSDVGMAKTHQW